MAHGDITGVDVGQTFPSQRALFDAGVHPEIEAGIADYGDGAPAESMVLGGGCPADIDKADVIVCNG